MRLQNPSTRVTTWHDKNPSLFKGRRCSAICSLCTSSYAFSSRMINKNLSQKLQNWKNIHKKTPYHQIISWTPPPSVWEAARQYSTPSKTSSTEENLLPLNHYIFIFKLVIKIYFLKHKYTSFFEFSFSGSAPYLNNSSAALILKPADT